MEELPEHFRALLRKLWADNPRRNQQMKYTIITNDGPPLQNMKFLGYVFPSDDNKDDVFHFLPEGMEASDRYAHINSVKIKRNDIDRIYENGIHGDLNTLIYEKNDPGNQEYVLKGGKRKRRSKHRNHRTHKSRKMRKTRKHKSRRH